MPITHAKVSGKSDGSDATQIQPSDWNDEHVGGSGLPPQWTDEGGGAVEAAIDDPTLDHILALQGPADWANDTLGGAFFIKAVDGDTDETVFYVDDFGDMELHNVGGGSANLRLSDADHPGRKTEVDGGFGVRVRSDSGQLQISDTANNLAFRADTTSGFLTTDGTGSVSAGREGSLIVNPTDQTLGTQVGLMLKGPHAAPDASLLAAGDLALWFDDTNGAASLKIKAKTSDGTVVTATIPLT